MQTQVQSAPVRTEATPRVQRRWLMQSFLSPTQRHRINSYSSIRSLCLVRRDQGTVNSATGVRLWKTATATVGALLATAGLASSQSEPGAPIYQDPARSFD